MLICADDFGYSDEVNESILDLCRHEKIHAVSVLVDKASDAACEKIASFSPKIQIGLHLDISIKSEFPSEQIRLQIEKFQKKIGFFPHYIDGHRHCHIYPFIADSLVTHLSQLSLPSGFYVRSLKIHPELKTSASGIDLFYIYFLEFLNRRFEKKLKNFNLRTNRYLWGSFNRHIDINRLYEIARKQSAKEDILFFHPGLRETEDGIDRKYEYEFIKNY